MIVVFRIIKEKHFHLSNFLISHQLLHLPIEYSINMSERYIPPPGRSDRQGQVGDTTTTNNNTQDSESSNPLRSLEQLSITHLEGRSYNNNNNSRGYGRGRGRGRGRGQGQGNNRGRGGWNTAINHHDSAPRDPPKADEFFLREIQNHFWPATGSRPITDPSTLNDSNELKKELVYVILYRDAHPKWDDKGIIFAHSSINILPGYTAAYANPGVVEMDEESREALAATMVGATRDLVGISFGNPAAATPSDDQVDPGQVQSTTTTTTVINNKPTNGLTRPIPVFSQSTPGREKFSTYFRFLGWYNLQDVEYLHPRSKDLARMLVDKWDIKDSAGNNKEIKRDRAKWLESMTWRWAVLKFEKMDEQAEMPMIERLPRDPPTRSMVGGGAQAVPETSEADT